MSHKVRTFFLSTLVLTGVFATAVVIAQTPRQGPIVRYTATTENVGVPGQTVNIEIAAWSTDAERDELVKAWTSVPAPDPSRGAAPPPAPAQPAGGRGNRGGGNRGDAPPEEAPVVVTPSTSLAAAVKKAPTAGMLWTTESAGYSVRYAYRLAEPDGSERIILATDRRLGAWNSAWKPTGTAALTDYQFSIIELRLNARGQGEGKVSLTTPISVDTAAKSIALENYMNAPVILKAVRRQN